MGKQKHNQGTKKAHLRIRKGTQRVGRRDDTWSMPRPSYHQQGQGNR